MQNVSADLCPSKLSESLVTFAYLLMCFAFLRLSSGSDALLPYRDF